MIIIGITGTLGAGKGTIVEYLLSHYNFTHYSARAFIEEEITARGLPHTREVMIEVANDLREKHSPSYIAESLYERAAQSGQDSIIESLRTVGEIEALRAKPGDFYLFAVDAPQRTRYERILLRHSSTDNVSFDEFVEAETKEWSSTDPHKQNLRESINRADFTFDNGGTREELYHQIDEVMKKLRI